MLNYTVVLFNLDGRFIVPSKPFRFDSIVDANVFIDNAMSDTSVYSISIYKNNVMSEQVDVFDVAEQHKA